MRPSYRFAFLPFVLVALAGSCSSKKTDHSLDTVEGFCNDWATAACNPSLVTSCGAASADACVAKQETFCASLVPDGKYSSTHAKDCVNAVGAAYSDGKLDANERNTVLRLGNTCALVLSGPGGKDADCTVDSDCNRDDGLSCVKRTGPSGKCETPAMVGAGLDCSALDSVCGTGFYCDVEASGSHCVSGSAPGANCSTGAPCDATSRCVVSTGDAGASSATCVPLSADKAPCSGDLECQSGICNIAEGQTSGKCGSLLPLSSEDVLCDNLQ